MTSAQQPAPDTTTSGEQAVNSGEADGSGSPDITTDGATAPPPKRTRWRRRLVLALVIFTCIGILASSVAVYAHRTLFDTDAWVETVGPLAADPAIQEAVATALTTQIVNAVDPSQLLDESLPDRAKFLATPLSSAFDEFVHKAMLQLIQTEQFQRLWVEANRVAHQVAVNVLRGDTKGITTEDGVVALNLLPVITRGLNFIEDKAPGLLRGKTVPDDITFSTPPDQARAELSSSLGRSLPASFGVVTLFQSDQLAAAQRAVVIIDRIVYLLIIVTVLLGVAALILSDRRLRTLVQLGVGTVLAIALASAGIRAVEQQIIGLIGNPEKRSAASAALEQLFESFRTLERTLLFVGIAVAVAAFLAGDSRLAVGIRNLVRRAVRGTSAAVQPTGSGSAPDATGVASVPLVADHKAVFQGAGVAVVAFVLLLVDITWARLLLAVVVLAVYELAITVVGDAVTTPPGSTGADADTPTSNTSGPP